MKDALIPSGRATVTGRAVADRKTIHVTDVEADPDYALPEVQGRARFRTLLGVPLLREGVPIGVIVLMRRHVHAFDQSQIELVTTFADQAVIALENVRLFNEVQERTQEFARSIDDLRARRNKSDSQLDARSGKSVERDRQQGDATFRHRGGHHLRVSGGEGSMSCAPPTA
jgi:GAF domain-containing protein